MTAKRKITDKNGVQVFPITHTKAVFDENGNSVEERLQENLDLINAKQFEEGDVEWDTEPNEDNNDHVVTSSGIHRVLTDDEFVIAKALVNLWLNLPRLDALENAMPNKMGEVEAEVIARALTEINAKSSSAGKQEISGTLTVNNSDMIDILSASFTDGSKPAKGKDWTTMLSSQTDYVFKNWAVSGSNCVGWMNNYVRNKKVSGRFAFVEGLIGNGTNYPSTEKAARLVCSTLLGVGVRPILCSNQMSPAAEVATVKQVTDEYKVCYISAPADYYGIMHNGNSGEGNDGWHLGTKDIGVWANATLPQMQHIDRPMQSMKLFRLRSGSASKTLDELVFHTNEERFVNFHELYFGQLRGGDEYETIRSNGSLTFNKGMLISAILPITSNNLTSVRLKFSTSDEVSVYCLDTIAQPYPTVSYYSRFTVPSEMSGIPEAGATYSDGSQVFAVAHIIMGENNSYFTMYCSPALDGTTEGGTLTKQSGTGAQTISYSRREKVVYSADSAVNQDNLGHWVELQNNNGYGFNVMSGYIQYDKVHFLITADGEFSISSPRIEYVGSEMKQPMQGVTIEFESNEYNPSEELMQEAVFGNVGTTLSHWASDSDNAITSVASYDGHYPFSHSVVEVSDTLAMNQQVSLTKGKYYLEVWAKYCHDNITEDSYDYNDLFISIESHVVDKTESFRVATFTTKKVGLAWTMVRIPISVPEADSIKFRLYSNEDGVQIGKVSLKKY